MTPTPAPNGTLVGYARVSSPEQNLEVQLDAPTSAGCTKVLSDTASGARAERPGLSEALGVTARPSRTRPVMPGKTRPRSCQMPPARSRSPPCCCS